MKEITDEQESSALCGKKRFYILWTETVEYVAEVRARTKKEARELFCKEDGQIAASAECLESRKRSGPFIREVKT